MIVFIRSTEAINDPRLHKYIDFVRNRNIKYLVIAWNRGKTILSTDNYIFYNRTSAYGAGLKNMFSLILFNFFIFKTLVERRKELKMIHACDFDTVLPAVAIKKMFRKRLIYDIFDWYIDSRVITNRFLKWLIERFETFSLKNADATIICEEERKEQLVVQPEELWVLPNIPELNNFYPEKSNKTLPRISLSYVGILSPGRGLEKVIRYARAHCNHVELHIAGMGQLQHQIEELIKGADNICYYGEVPYSKGLRIMEKSDLILAFYEKWIPNHLYAAPNKYYEGLFLGRPILTTVGTLVGHKTETLKTGFVIGEEYEDIESFFQQSTLRSAFKEAGAKARELWELKYSRYVMDFFDHTYSDFLTL